MYLRTHTVHFKYGKMMVLWYFTRILKQRKREGIYSVKVLQLKMRKTVKRENGIQID